MCQVGGERVEPQPAERREANSIVRRDVPNRSIQAHRRDRSHARRNHRAPVGPQPEIHASRQSGSRGELFVSSTGSRPATPASRQSAYARAFQRRRRPSNSCADGPEPDVRRLRSSRPNCGGIACRAARNSTPRSARSPARGHRVVRVKEFGLVAFLRRSIDVAARDPSAERRVRLDGESVQRHVDPARARARAHVASPTSRVDLLRQARRSGRARHSRSRRGARSSTARAIAAASWVRCIHARTRSSNDCAPIDNRFTPAPTPGVDARSGDSPRDSPRS